MAETRVRVLVRRRRVCSVPSTSATNWSWKLIPKAPTSYSAAMEPHSVRVYLNEVRYLTDATCSMAAEMAGFVVGDEEPGSNSCSGQPR